MGLVLLSSGRRGPIPLHRRGGRREAVGVVAFWWSNPRAGQPYGGGAVIFPGLHSRRRRSM